MQYGYMGASNLRVSKICLGTMHFGGVTPEAESHAIMDKALEMGINFFDTANVYGGPPAPAPPRRSSATGSPRAADAATRSCWPPRPTTP
jgi:aryl-alcohol dehydrogenase-like predicted oxidoreductase